MRGARVALVMLAVLALVGAVAAVSADSAEYREAEVYSVEYVLDGGELPYGAATAYVSGSYMELPVPSNGDLWFAGWYLDEGLTVPIGGISKDASGDLVLYAKWVDVDPTGLGWTMDVEGSYTIGDTTYTISGTVDFGYEAGMGGRLLQDRSNDYTYSSSDWSWTNTSVSYSWTAGIWDGWTFVGYAYADGVPVTVWESDGSTMWLLDLLIPLRIESPLGDGTAVQTTTSVYRYEPETTYEPIVVAEYPVSVDSPGTAELGEPVTLTAEGDDFAGWYVNGSLVSTERTVTLFGLTPATEIVAASSAGYLSVSDGTDMFGLGFGDATFYDSAGEEVDPSGLPTGYYTCSVHEDGVTTTAEFVVDETRTLTIEWTWEGETYSLSVDVSYSQQYLYAYLYPDMPRFSMHQQSYVETYYTCDDPLIRYIAEQLAGMGAGMDRAELAGFVLRFVQSIPYIEDSESRGQDEYWKFPAETLWDGGGDCEDTAFLYGTLMGVLGYRVALVLFMDHAMAAVSLDADGFTVSVDGYEFVMCETTSTGFEVGDTSEGHLPDDATYVCRIESITYSN